MTRNDDVFTLDAWALRSAVLAAQQNGIEYLWLDAWAYRKQPPFAEYHHDDFVRTLVSLATKTAEAVHLP